MPDLTPILRAAGFRGKALTLAKAVAQAESRGNPAAHNTNAGTGDNSYGEFQINMLGGLGPARRAQFGLSSNDQLLDPTTNAKVAFALSKGGTDWSPWSTYKSGAYKQFLGGSQVSTFGGGAASQAPSAVGAPAADSRSAFVQSLLGSIGPTGQISDPSALVQALRSRGTQQAAQPSAGPQPAAGQGGIAELLQEGTGGPTHSTGPHIHAAFTDPRLELAAIGYAQSHGLHVGENPYVGGVAPVHAPNSYHKRTFPGLYNGKRLGEAIDVSGGDTSGFYKWLASRR